MTRVIIDFDKAAQLMRQAGEIFWTETDSQWLFYFKSNGTAIYTAKTKTGEFEKDAFFADKYLMRTNLFKVEWMDYPKIPYEEEYNIDDDEDFQDMGDVDDI